MSKFNRFDIVMGLLTLILNIGSAALGWVTPQWALTMLLIHGALIAISVYRREQEQEEPGK